MKHEFSEQQKRKLRSGAWSTLSCSRSCLSKILTIERCNPRLRLALTASKSEASSHSLGIGTSGGKCYVGQKRRVKKGSQKFKVGKTMEKLEEFKVGKTRRQPIPDGNPTETLNIWDVSKSIIGRPQDMYHIGIRGCIAFPAGWYAGHGESQQFDANHSTAIVNLDELRTFCTIWSQNISEWGIPKSQSVIGFHRFPHLNCHTCAIAFAFFGRCYWGGHIYACISFRIQSVLKTAKSPIFFITQQVKKALSWGYEQCSKLWTKPSAGPFILAGKSDCP